MKAARITQPRQLEIIDIPIPDPLDNELVLKVMASGICGTDIHIFDGEYMGAYPVIPGHEFSSIVHSIGKNVTKFKIGDRAAVEPNISCDNCYNCLNNRQNLCLNWQAIGVTKPGGMAQYVAVPEKAVFHIGDMPFEYGMFVEPLSCVIYGIERTKITIGDRIAIIGAGPIGILLSKTARLQGASEITIVDKNTARIEFAKNEGADICLYNIDNLKNDFYDVVIDATGSIPLISKTVDFVRYGGKVLLFGVAPAGKLMEIEPFKIFRKDLTILSSFTSRRNSYQAINLLETKRIDVSKLISHKLPLEQLERGIEIIKQEKDNVRKIMIAPNE